MASKYRRELDNILSKGCQENQTQEIEGKWRKIENTITKTTEKRFRNRNHGNKRIGLTVNAGRKLIRRDS